MTQTMMLDGAKLESIFHPSDFSEASEVAFVHALKIALVAGTKLKMLRAEASPGAEWQDFPCVRDTLERWGLIPRGSPKSGKEKGDCFSQSPCDRWPIGSIVLRRQIRIRQMQLVC